VKAVWSGKPMIDAVRDRWRDLIGALLNHSLPPTPALIPPSDAAMALWASAHDKLEALRHGEPDDRMRAARSKLIGLIPRLSLIFQMVSAASGEGHAMVRLIDATSMKRAITVVDWATRETKRVYAMLASEIPSKEQEDTDEKMIRYIQKHGGQVTARNLMRSFRRFRTSATLAHEYLDSMVQDGMGHWELIETGGRTASVFILKAIPPGDTSPTPKGVRGDTSAVLDAPGASVTVTAVTTETRELCDGV
jgi:hypothetical protein